MSDDPDRIYLEPEHAQIEGRMWCIDNDPASLGEPWTEYVRADLYAALEAERDAYRDERDVCFDTLVKMRDSRDALLSDVKRLEYAIREADSWRARYANIALKLDSLTAERDRWMSNAHGAQKLSLEYLRERDRYREALEKVEPWMGQPFADMDEMTHGSLREEWFGVPSCSWEYWLIEKMQNTFRAILNALNREE